MNLKATVFIVFILLLTSLTTYAQKQTLVGLNINSNIYPDEFKPNIGATFERQFTKRSGIETGLYYHTKQQSAVIPHTDSTGSYSYSFTVSERHWAVPVLYKYYSRLVNFSVGPSFDLFVGWRQKNNGSPVQIQSYTVNPKIKIGFLTKLSKPIPLNQQFVLEPEIRFGSVQTLDEANVGIGISGKYRF